MILGRLGRIEESAEAWLALARDLAVDNRMRVEAAKALGRLGRTEESARLLLALARDPAVELWVLEHTAETVAAALGELGQVEKAAELLLALVRDLAVDHWVRARAAKALGELDQATQEVLAGLRALAGGLGTPESVRQAAREALERLEG
jgi:uncharacterized protein (UPF0147 family)